MQVISLEINTTEFHILQSNSQLIPAASSQFQQDFFCLLMRFCTDSFVKRLILTLNVSHVLKISNDFKCRDLYSYCANVFFVFQCLLFVLLDRRSR